MRLPMKQKYNKDAFKSSFRASLFPENVLILDIFRKFPKRSRRFVFNHNIMDNPLSITARHAKVIGMRRTLREILTITLLNCELTHF